MRLEHYRNRHWKREFPNFNSIKVRLEPMFALDSFCCLSIFQFHKGAIRTTLAVDKLEEIEYFNSIKVRLEPASLELAQADFENFNSIKVRLERFFLFLYYSVISFQFHKGAIRTFTQLGLSSSLPSFQFHKGAIRTR